MGGRPKAELVLEDEVRAELERVSRVPTSAQRDVLRARIVLLSATGQTNQEVASELGVCAHTVGKWRQRFVDHGLMGLLDAPRPKEHLRLSDRKVTEIVRATLEKKPRGSTHWSTRQMAKHAGVSQATVMKVWRVSPQAPSSDDVLAEHRRVLHGQGPRCRGSLHESARQRGGVVYRREVADSGARTRTARAPDDHRPHRARLAHIHPARHHSSLPSMLRLAMSLESASASIERPSL